MNNKLFDIVGGKVVIHTDTLGIPCFKAIWEQYEDKEYANKVISYIAFKHHPDSPYVVSMNEEYREKKLVSEYFTEDWEPTREILYAESMYLEFQDTLLLQLLTASRSAVGAISGYLKSVLASSLDMRMVKEAMTALGQLDKVVRSMASLEKQVRKEEVEVSRVQGGSEISAYEIPKQR